ncbi:MAG: hypothetical protein ABFD97_10975 [Syntrophobacter sp.]
MISMKSCTIAAARGVSALWAAAPPWLKLIIGFILVWVCIFTVGNLSTFIPGARHMAEVIDERNLRATAVYYTDLEESHEGSQYIRHSLEYPPGKE